jgi:hypothetical protein
VLAKQVLYHLRHSSSQSCHLYNIKLHLATWQVCTSLGSWALTKQAVGGGVVGPTGHGHGGGSPADSPKLR